MTRRIPIHCPSLTSRSCALFGVPESCERISISLRENNSNAEAYNANAHPQVLKILSKVIDGTSKIRTFEAVALNLDHCIVAERQSF